MFKIGLDFLIYHIFKAKVLRLVQLWKSKNNMYSRKICYLVKEREVKFYQCCKSGIKITGIGQPDISLTCSYKER